jgi:hypothetical protein
MINAHASVTLTALSERIGEPADMPRRLPHFRMHEDGTVEPHDIVVIADHRLPPRVPDIPRELDTVRAKVIDGCETAIDFRRWKDETATLGKRDDFLHQTVLFFCHSTSLNFLSFGVDKRSIFPYIQQIL